MPRTSPYTIRLSSAELAQLEKRAAELWKQQTNPAAGPTATLIESLAIVVRSLGTTNASADRITKVIVALTVVGVVIAGSNLWLVRVQIKDADKVAGMQNSISLNGQFYHDPVNLQDRKSVV